MHRARGLYRPGLSAAFPGGSRAFSGTPGPDLGPEAESDPELVRGSSAEVERRLRGLAVVKGGFVSDEEAEELLREVEPALRRGRYQRDHWDRFCGCTIAGLSLLSPSVLRLRSLRDPRDHLELLLLPGSLYVLRGAARFEFTHEILGDPESFFGGLRVPRGRRVALLFRNDPPETPPDPLSDLPAFIEDPRDPSPK